MWFGDKDDPMEEKRKEREEKGKIVLQLAVLPLQSENRHSLQWSVRHTPRVTYNKSRHTDLEKSYVQKLFHWLPFCGL